MNDAEAMSSCIQKMSGKAQAAELFLRALSDARGADPGAARARLTGLADQTGNPDVALKALWILYEAARSSGDPGAQAVLREKMAARFAAAPETALAVSQSASGPATRGTVIQMPAPGPFDAEAVTTQPVPEAQQGTQPVPQTEQSTQPQAPTMSVQAGSFVMKENADDLVSELTRRGFAPVVIHDSAQGKDRYRVIVGTGLAADAAKDILKKLSAAGFRGFLMQDK